METYVVIMDVADGEYNECAYTSVVYAGSDKVAASVAATQCLAEGNAQKGDSPMLLVEVQCWVGGEKVALERRCTQWNDHYQTNLVWHKGDEEE